jgi:hypothetical protein
LLNIVAGYVILLANEKWSLSSMFSILKTLWKDDSGVILTMEIILIATVILLGVLAGLATLRDGIITEMADIGGSLSNLDQSYVLHGAVSHSSATAGTVFNDLNDFGDDPNDPIVVNQRCLVVCAGAPVVVPIGNEGAVVTTP